MCLRFFQSFVYIGLATYIEPFPYVWLTYSNKSIWEFEVKNLFDVRAKIF